MPTNARISLVFAMAAGLAAVTAPAAAQQPPRRTLDRPAATFPEPVSDPVGFRVLGPARVIVADQLEQSVSILDFRTGEVTPVGRTGDGPGEFGMPGPLYAGPGDTTYMLDMGNRRLLVLLPDATISPTTVPLTHRSGVPVLPRGVDAHGRVYFDLGGIAMPGLEESARTGRAPLLRWDPRTGQTDTLGVVSFPPMQPTGPGEVRISMGGGAYQPRDDWAVLPDGRVGLARAVEYQVEWLGSARPVVGPKVAYTPVKVGDAEKNAWADQMATRGMIVQVENGRRRTSRPPRPNIDRITWPEVMPAFTGSRSVLAAPTGELWVRRAQPASADGATYDVFDQQGRVTRQVVLAGNRVVLAVGQGVAFVSRTDEDDLVWIERFDIP
jgi:hypothetical protein